MLWGRVDDRVRRVGGIARLLLATHAHRWEGGLREVTNFSNLIGCNER